MCTKSHHYAQNFLLDRSFLPKIKYHCLIRMLLSIIIIESQSPHVATSVFCREVWGS